MKYMGITTGDPAGIGPEISLRALDGQPKYLDSTILYGSPGILRYHAERMGLKHPLHIMDSPEDFAQGHINVLPVLDISYDDLAIGQVSPVGGDAAYRYCEAAIGHALSGQLGAVVTAPLNKEALHLGGHHFDGHTEIFATLTGTKSYAMMLWTEGMSVIHVSTHCALAEACRRAKKPRVLECIRLADKAMKQLGIVKPRIAVAGLNPHSGENGLFGREEIEEIRPAIEEALAQGLNVDGPVPPDTVFLKTKNGQYDIVVAMYHDQGHIPMKLLAFDSGVNTTLGLPIIRTSVDHGTAFDIAGKYIAREESMLWALGLAYRFMEHT